MPCGQVNPDYWLSGDPVTNNGWIGIQEKEVRGIASTGPFTLVKDQEVEILIGYEIDRGTTPLGGITAVRAVSDYVQTFYENNFDYPIVSVEDEIPGVLNFILKQNYPNPFNPSTTIRYEIPEQSFVTIKVYDVLGNEIVTLLNEEKSAGSYEVTFDSHSGNVRNLTSGIYFYKLQAGSFVETKKMILLK